ncbi:unnamed protein product [Rotaria sp. Silwood1]|nr:unnamed protein product [Rotaria sp. Silwood1]CAF3685439.1 unnamed protein product [Rotaria sp. Silwood1]CAF4874324.1 unnamed protein product [Rotaria sp. Silwood1]
MACLKSDVKMYSKTLIAISISNTSERPLQDIDEEQVSSLCFQLLIEVIYRFPQTLTAQQQMIEECRENDVDNPSQLRLIGTQNIDTIFNYHYFLTDLFKQLTTLYQDQFGKKTGKLTVYCGQQINAQKLEKLKINQGRLISINTFFSISTSCSVAVDFSDNGEHQSMGIGSVVFEIDIDLNKAINELIEPVGFHDEWFAIVHSNIGMVFDARSELFSTIYNGMATIFQRQAIKHYTAAWQCYMNRQAAHRKEIAITRHNIAVIQRDFGNYEQACTHLHESLSILNEEEYEIRSQFCAALAETYVKMNDWPHARVYFQTAIELAAQAKNSTESIVVTYRNNLEKIMSMIDNNTVESSIQ